MSHLWFRDNSRYYKHWLVYGYIRRFEKRNKYLQIPNDIQNVCILFYAIVDFFAIHTDKIRVTHQKFISIAEGTTDKSIVYGNEIIEPNDESIDEYIWTFRAWNLDKDPCYIGLCDIDEQNENIAKLTHAFKKIRIRFIIQMHFQFNREEDWIELIVSREKKHEKKDFNYVYELTIRREGYFAGRVSIDGNKKYRMGVVLGHKEQKIELQHFRVMMNKDDLWELWDWNQKLRAMWDAWDSFDIMLVSIILLPVILVCCSVVYLVLLNRETLSFF